MKKIVASALILTMLSSTGAMCFADEGAGVSVSSSSLVEDDGNDTSDREVIELFENQELARDLESVKSDISLTFKQEVARCWEAVKSFVKKHWIKGLLAVQLVLLPLLVNWGRERTHLQARIANAMASFAPIYDKINAILNTDDSKIVVNVHPSEQDKAAIEKFERAFREYYNMIEEDVIDAELMDKALTDYATDELLGIIRSEENNKIVDKFLEVMEF